MYVKINGLLYKIDKNPYSEFCLDENLAIVKITSEISDNIWEIIVYKLYELVSDRIKRVVAP